MTTYGKPLLTLILLLVLSACTIPSQSAISSCALDYDSIDAVLTSCPSDCELTSIERDFSIVFDESIDIPEYGCQDGQDYGGDPNPRLVFFQLLRSLAAMEFEQPLPWTDLSLYEWLKDTVDGFVISGGAESYCCDDHGRIVLSQERLLLPLPARWDSPHRGIALGDLAALIIHEARHAEFGPHTCGENDSSVDELGPWGVQNYFYVWLAEHTSPGMLSDLQVQCALAHAQMNLIHFCDP